MTTLRIRDVVSANPNARFRNDVQMSSYRGADNLDLVKSFIFTRKAAQGKRSSLDLLQMLCDAYLPAKNPNRFTVVATYGQGKSHFGLALANFFGKTNESEELVPLLKAIGHAAADDATAAQFRAFKEHHHPFLIVILRGDEPGDLQAKFYRGLEEALSDNPATRGVQLPFWYAEAEQYVMGISGDLREKAERYLGAQGMDLASVTAGLKRREPGMHDVCRQLAYHLVGFYPDFGRLTSLREAVEWVADNVCTEGNVSGMMILFDEFSAFVRNYGLQAKARPGTPLLDLLNGVENRRSKVVFVALSQHDPDTVATSILKSDPQNLNSLLHELNRLPVPQRHILHTELEAVVDSYLKQDKTRWATMVSDPDFARALFSATDTALATFRKRYQENLGWTTEDFQSTVSAGCYPLHPMTTALLSSVEFRSTATPRSVLGFVEMSLRSMLDESVLDGQRPRWVWPTSLVKYFREMLGEEHWAAYQEARVQAGGPDSREWTRDVLKGVLLQVAGGVPTKSLGYAKVLSHLCGHPAEDVQSELDELAKLVIRRDAQGFYTFWPIGRGAGKLGEALGCKKAQIGRDGSVFTAMNGFLAEEAILLPQSVSLAWGHLEDWCARQLVLFRAQVTPELVRALVTRWTCWAPDGQALPRGVILWALAESEDDVSFLRKNGAVVLDDALGDEALPVVLALPRSPQTELVDALLEMQAILSMTTQEILDVGKDQFEIIKQDRRNQLRNAMRVLEAPHDYIVPKACRTGVDAAHVVGAEATVGEVFRHCYPYGIHDFFPQYKSEATNFRKAVAQVCGHLISGSRPDGLSALGKNRVVHEIYAAVSENKWGLVGSDASGVRIPGENSRSYAGWQVLETALPVGPSTLLAGPFKTLLNPPYGYDFNTLSLLLAGWLGVHRFDLDLAVGGQSTPLDATIRDSDGSLKTPRQFIAELSKGKITRREGPRVDVLLGLLEKAKTDGLSETAAMDVRDQIVKALADPRVPADMKADAQRVSSEVSGALAKAHDYDQAASRIIRQAGVQDVARLCESLRAVRDLPVLTRVMSQQPSPVDLRSTLLGQLVEAVHKTCCQYETLADLGHHELNVQRLLDCRSVVSKAGEPIDRIEQALSNLSVQRERLDAEFQDAQAVATIHGLPTHGNLLELRNHLARLADLVLNSELARKLSADKKSVLEKKVAELTALPQELGRRLDGALTSKNLQAIRDEMLRVEAQFTEAPEHKTVKDTIHRSEVLAELFLQHENTVAGSPSSLEQSSERISRLQGLETQARAALSDLQAETLAALRRQMETLARDLGNRELQRLHAWEQLVDAGKLGDAAHSLTWKPAFLAASDTTRLQTLRAAVTAMIDKDEDAAVEGHFRQISTSSGRRECIRRLEAINAELGQR